MPSTSIDVGDDYEPPQKKTVQSTIKPFAVRNKVEDIIAKEATLGASYSYITKSPMIKGGLSAHGYSQPKSTTTVSKYVEQSAEDEKAKVKASLVTKTLLKEPPAHSQGGEGVGKQSTSSQHL